MDTTRLQRPARVRIESATTVPGTRVYIDDKDVTNDVVAVTWTVDANDRRPPTATITFIQAEISGEAELTEQAPEPTAGLEFRAVDLAVLDLKPGDAIVLRSKRHLSDKDVDDIEAIVKRQLPGHEVLVLDGGLELSVLHPAEPALPGFATGGDRERFLAMFGDRLDDWFTPEFAAFVRRGPQPVVPRERVIPMGGPFRGFKPSGITTDELQPAEPPAPRQPPVGLRRTPDQWCAHYGVEIHNPDGWRHADAPPWDQPITLPDFCRRAAESTVRDVASEGWRGVGRDAAATAAEHDAGISGEIDFAEVRRYYDGTMHPPYPEPAGPVEPREHAENSDEPTEGGSR